MENHPKLPDWFQTIEVTAYLKEEIRKRKIDPIGVYFLYKATPVRKRLFSQILVYFVLYP